MQRLTTIRSNAVMLHSVYGKWVIFVYVLNMEQFSLRSPAPSAAVKSGACRGLTIPGTNTWLCATLPNSSIEECEKDRHSKTTCPALCYVQKDYAKETSPQVKIRKRECLYKSRITLRNNSKERERVRHRLLHGTFGEKKSKVCFGKNVGALLKNSCSAESILTTPNDILSEKSTLWIWAFLQ